MQQPVIACGESRISILHQKSHRLAHTLSIEGGNLPSNLACQGAIIKVDWQDRIAQVGYPQCSLELRMVLAIALEMHITQVIQPAAQGGAEPVLVRSDPGAGFGSPGRLHTADSDGRGYIGCPSLASGADYLEAKLCPLEILRKANRDDWLMFITWTNHQP